MEIGEKRQEKERGDRRMEKDKDKGSWGGEGGKGEVREEMRR